jgi:hypothetical protein
MLRWLVATWLLLSYLRNQLLLVELVRKIFVGDSLVIPAADGVEHLGWLANA